MLRILRITPHFYRPGVWPVAFDPVGGLQNQTWTIAEGMDRAGAAQTVLTTYIPGSPRRTDLFCRTHVKCVGVWLPEFLAGPLLNFTWFLAVVPELFRARRDFDLVHIHFNHSVWCRAIAMIVRRLHIPLVVSLNTALWGGLQQALRLKNGRFDVTRWLERAALKSADHVVALTTGAATSVIGEMGLDHRRVSVVPDAIDAEKYRRPVDAQTLGAFRARHGVPQDAPIVSFVGRISTEKGWQDLPVFVEQLSDQGVFLLVCGDGPDRRRLEAALAALARPGSWAITGFMSPAEVGTALKLSDVLILPSRREAFGSVLLEAMAAEVPAVAYDVGGIGDVAGWPQSVSLVPAGRCSDFVHRILHLLTDGPAREALRERGRTRVKDFSVGSSVALSLRLYHRILSLDGPRTQVESLALQEGGGSPEGS